MYFVIAGVLIILLNLFGVGPSAEWNWELFGDLWKFMVPFLLALLWWGWTEQTGWDKRREMDRMEKKKELRRKENMAALGLNKKSRRKR
jgi:small Trp-rich protein